MANCRFDIATIRLKSNIKHEKRVIMKKHLTVNMDAYDNGEVLRECPHCHELKPISEFGYRDMGDGEIRNQSWCKDCR